MGRLPPAVAATRSAVRACLADLPATSVVLVACSGGPDSLALAAAAGFVGPRSGLRVGLVTVDHGLQDGSALRAVEVAARARDAGLDPVEVATVTVDGVGGPEAAARRARYAALDDAAARHSATVLLGHTRDDQAETVLLALARGAGPRGLSGMAARRGRYRRPFLTLPRASTVAACAELDLSPWTDPHNSDPGYARSRLRAAMSTLESLLGAGFVANLARTADLIAADTELLDAWAATALADAADRSGPPAIDPARTAGVSGPADLVGSAGQSGPSGVARDGLDVGVLAGLPRAIRTRVLHAYARDLGAPGSDLTAGHVAALDALLTDWHGQGPVYLPGGITVRRRAGRLAPEGS